MTRTSLWLLGLIASLLLVGLVSHTPIRHAIQISPCVLSLGLLYKGYKWGPASALPLFAFWFILMTFIWLFLLGIARIVTGHFTPVEIALTIVIGICCACGFPLSLKSLKGSPILPALAMFTLQLALQTAALWLSMRPEFARI